jgi:hypothetical protein
MLEGLPELEVFEGDWEEFIERVYQIYLDLIVKPDLRFKNLAVQPRFSPETKSKHYGFWHLTSSGQVEEDREPDLRRCERIRWVSWLIENYRNFPGVVYCWQEKRKNTNEIVIWFEEEHYVVILSERRDYWLLKTAYLVTKKYKLEQMIKSRKKFCGE